MPPTELRIQKPEINVNRKIALSLSELQGREVFELFALANSVRMNFRGNRVDLCSIINAKSGACPEDCSFCAQSANSRANIEVYSLMNR
ncbi:MAG: hypothetical protein AABZ36_03840, partial [Nitrospirota bacterium]